MKFKKLKVSNSQKEYQTHEKPKRPNWRARCPLARAPGALKGSTFSHFLTSIVAKHQKIEGGLFGERNFPKEVSQCRKKMKGGTLWDFSTPILSRNIKKLKGDPLGIFSKKSLTMPKKTERRDPLVSPCTVCYAEKQEKPFWFSSLGQMIQFGTIKFCGTFRNYFSQFVWIEKKRVTIVVAFHFMKRRLKSESFIVSKKVESADPCTLE